MSARTEPLDLLSVECFLAAAQGLNFRAAAASLHLSPSALGQRIAGLESDLGQPLFVRTTRRVSLTPAGERAVPLAQRLLHEADRFRSEAASPERAPFSMVIATRFELGLSWLTPALERLEALRPDRTLSLSFGDSDDMDQRVQSRAVDAAVTSSRTLLAHAHHVTLHEERYALVGHRTLLETQPLESREHAAQHTLIDIDPRLPLFRYFLDARPDDEPWRFSRTHYLGTIGAIRMRVLAGHGIAVLPEYFIAGGLAAGELVRLCPETSPLVDAFRLVWLDDHPKDDCLRELAADLRGIPLS